MIRAFIGLNNIPRTWTRRALYCTSPAVKPKVSMDSIWALWNEGNLFSLSVSELQDFLKSQRVEVSDDEKKTSLVRKIEDLMSKEQPAVVRSEEVAVANLFEGEGNSGAGDLYEESDLYGDWGQDVSISKQTELSDALHINLSASAATALDPLEVRSFLLLHENTTPEVALVPLDTSNLPGSLAQAKAYTIQPVDVYASNRRKFILAFSWGLMNMAQLGFEGNLNVNFGRSLMNHKIQLFKRTIVPMWSIQKAVGTATHGRFVSLCHERNQRKVDEYIQKNGYAVDSEEVVTYIAVVKRTRDPVVVELNSELQPINALRSWDRTLITHNIRLKMPDVRFMLRGRTPLKKRIATPFFESEILRFKQDKVESVLAPELGEIQYVAERVITSWSKTIMDDITLRIQKVKRTPVLTVRDIDAGERLEYELDISLPSNKDGTVGFDASTLGGLVYDESLVFAKLLESGVVSYKANSVASLED